MTDENLIVTFRVVGPMVIYPPPGEEFFHPVSVEVSGLTALPAENNPVLEPSS